LSFSHFREKFEVSQGNLHSQCNFKTFLAFYIELLWLPAAASDVLQTLWKNPVFCFAMSFITRELVLENWEIFRFKKNRNSLFIIYFEAKYMLYAVCVQCRGVGLNYCGCIRI
jgi:hypothetical protein